MPARTRHYRKKPLAVFEHGTRIYAPTANEPRYRVVAADAGGARLFHKFAGEEDARAKARELEAYLADRTPWRSSPDAPHGGRRVCPPEWWDLRPGSPHPPHERDRSRAFTAV